MTPSRPAPSRRGSSSRATGAAPWPAPAAGVRFNRIAYAAAHVVAEQVALPPGYTLLFSGQFEFWEKTLPRPVSSKLVSSQVTVAEPDSGRTRISSGPVAQVCDPPGGRVSGNCAASKRWIQRRSGAP